MQGTAAVVESAKARGLLGSIPLTRAERFLTGAGLPALLAWLMASLVVLLLLFIVYMTFVEGIPTEPTLTLGNYREVFSFRFFEILGNTALVGLGTTLVCTFFGVAMAWLVHRTDVPIKSALMSLVAISVIIPGFMIAMGWILLLSPRIGLVNLAIMQLFGLSGPPFNVTSIAGVVWVQGLMLTPSMFFLVSGPMRSLDPALEEAAEVSGGTRWHTLWRISLPLMWPAILAGMIYNFMTAISVFEVAGILVGLGTDVPLLATQLFVKTAGSSIGSAIPQYGLSGVYGLVIALPSMVALYLYYQVIRQSHRYVVVTGKGYRPNLSPLGRLRYVGLSFCLLYVLLAVLLPFVVLLWTALLPALKLPSAEAFASITLANFANVGNAVDEKVLRNSAILVLTAPIVVLFFALMVSWVVVRTTLPGRQVLDSLAMLPHAIPGLGFAFAILILAIFVARYVPWVPLYGTIIVIVLANVVNRLAYATRATNAALIQVSQELEDAAAMSGCGRLGTIRRVLIPLIGPSLVFAGLWTALLCFREVGMALLLLGPDNVVLAARAWSLWYRGAIGDGAALSVVMVVVMAVLFFLVQRFSRTRLYDEMK